MVDDKTLSKQEIVELKARAHHLNPVVMVGQKGLTEAVIQETDTVLRAHELIKVRVLGDDRAERVLIGEELCSAVNAQLIQHIGKLLVLYREHADDEQEQ
ncbi:ribosome assembly RNA-binding protein YhbY [Wielerella bovis]|uniref:ribosome assembly RNA-binding protein YhbY n=1 Tax=Wielerella bovis TaxID=2917790 RepID=UPI0020186B44|nr:ribosome assembly RNA-binding protein YhbY [Wielerella bovis]ULJ61842.1 ribosome assembly RNA-binding protein YhbY [Wielerella bovis]ULJ63967.1 ribosome assembly RNA-binding protein YhbY [Wielerella bovis]ULJ68052.1 ribosome assembly RNA-binding protein YhbY [Wielerella bovis]